jgi:amino acid transporter
MSNVIKFPRASKQPVEPVGHTPMLTVPARAHGKGLLGGLVKFLWVLTVLIWPVAKWILSLDVLFQFVRMLYHWNTPGDYAGWTFLLHFAVLTAITYFVSLYRPKGL